MANDSVANTSNVTTEKRKWKFKKVLLILLGIVLLVTAWIRYVEYPTMVRMECNDRAMTLVEEGSKTTQVYPKEQLEYEYNFAYNVCLRDYGLSVNER